jgi:hypothetical protein
MTAANAVWCHNPLIIATMYNTQQGVTHASVTRMLYYIIFIIITTIGIIVKINIASFDVFVIIVYH